MRLNWLMKCLVAGVAVCAFAQFAEAQPGGGRQRGGFGGGGFGGRGGSSLVSLAANEAVQKELGLNDDAKESVKKLSEAYREEMQKAMGDSGGFGNFRDMSDEERQKAMEKMNETRKTVSNKFIPQVKDVLTAAQFKRLQEIHVQALRDQAYSDADVAKTIGLRKDQQDKIAAINKEFSEKQRALFTGGGDGGQPDFRAMRGKMEELGKERDAEISAVLTKDQQDKFATLKGKEFDLAQLMPRGFGGPGGGGPGRPQGGGDGARPKRPQPQVD